jgi:hypothetical protein
MGGRVRDRETAAVVLDMSAATREVIENIIHETPIDWTQITGLITNNSEIKAQIDNLIELFLLNNYVANQPITPEMIDYFNTLLSNLTITVAQITNFDTVNDEFKLYIQNQLTDFATQINNLVLGDTYTAELKQYIDESILTLQTALTQLISTTANNQIEVLIEQINTLTGQATRLISGSVVWIQNLDFQVSALEYQILNQRITAPETLVTIPPNAAADPVFAVIFADLNGNIGYVLGTPAASPAVPLVDDLTQIALTTVLIPALGTAPEPGTITTEVIYNENIEWTTAKVEETGVVINLENTTEPATGTKHISLAVTAGTATELKGALLTSSEIQDGLNVAMPAITPATLTYNVSELFADHKTNSVSGLIRHLVYYRILRRQAIVAYLIDRTDGAKYDLLLGSWQNQSYTFPGYDLTVQAANTIVFGTMGQTIPVGNYALIVSGFTRYDQQYNITSAPNISPVAAAMSFTRTEAIDSTGGNISLSMKISAALLANTGLLFDLYNGTTKTGTAAMLPGNQYGFNPENTGEYQRVIIPISAFNASSGLVTKLVIRPVNAWPNGSLFIDNVVLQTGLNTTAAQIQADWNESNAKAAAFIKNKPALGSISPKDFWTGTAAAYAAIDPKLSNTIYFVEE